jgi:hypothetical protein
MLKQGPLEATVVAPLLIEDVELQLDDDLAGSAYHHDDPSEIALLKHELGELRREIREARDKLDTSVRLARRRDRIRVAAAARRRRGTKGRAVSRAILSVMVAVFTLGGTIGGLGVGVAVLRLWGDSAVALVVAVVAGLAVALAAWLLAALAAIVVETADAVRDLPA